MSENRIADFVKIRVIVYDWDIYDEVKEHLLKLLEGLDLKKEKIVIEENEGKGFVSSGLIVLEVRLEKWRHIKKFLENLKRYLTKDSIMSILENLEKIVDERGSLYLRFDKDYFINNKKLKFVEHGDVFHIKITFRAFPKNKENVLDVIRSYFERILQEIENNNEN